jgi:phage tail sheath protein FI
MPEYLYPGVYVTEVALNSKPIEGVSTSTISLLGSELIAELQRLVDKVPGKDADGNDFGIALLELMAWISDTLTQRADQLGDEAYLPAARIAAAALTLVRNRVPPPNSVLNVVRFYEVNRLQRTI